MKTLVPATIRAEIVGFGQDVLNDNDHHVRFSINDQTLADAIWDGKSRYHLEVTTSSDHLLNGSNDFKVGVFTDTSTIIPDYFFDWFEIDYLRRFVAQDNQLTFSVLPKAPSEPQPEQLVYLPFETAVVSLDLSIGLGMIWRSHDVPDFHQPQVIAKLSR